MVLLKTVKKFSQDFPGHGNLTKKSRTFQEATTKETRELPGEKEIMQGTMACACRRGRPHTAWMDNIKTWTRFSVEESIRMTEDRDMRRKYVHGVANPRIKDG